jgi:hypothetical protein
MRGEVVAEWKDSASIYSEKCRLIAIVYHPPKSVKNLVFRGYPGLRSCAAEVVTPLYGGINLLPDRGDEGDTRRA